MVDLIGSGAMIIISWLCLRLAHRIYVRDPENALSVYILWFCMAIFAFSASRSLGHIVKHVLYFSGHIELWKDIAPISGSINTITFVLIASVTLFFQRMQTIMNRMIQDRLRIRRTSMELLKVNKEIEKIVSERTRAEMALRLAHEVRNPVMVIGGLLNRILKADSVSQKDLRGHINRILEQAKRLEKLVKRLEGLLPDSQEHFISQELNSIVQEALDTIASEAGDKGIEINFDRSSASLDFKGNRQLVKLAVIHILRNAINACASGDSIKIGTRLGPEKVIARIEDTGPGIPREILEHVFEPFYRTGKGDTGLGLPYVKQIIEEHRGNLSITSELGHGTVVEIWLPTHLGELKS